MVKVGCICASCLYSGKVVVFGRSGCIWAILVLFEQIGCRWAKLLIFVQIGCNRSKLLYSGKVDVFGQK